MLLLTFIYCSFENERPPNTEYCILLNILYEISNTSRLDSFKIIVDKLLCERYKLLILIKQLRSINYNLLLVKFNIYTFGIKLAEVTDRRIWNLVS